MSDAEKIEKLSEALRQIVRAMPCCNEGMFFYPRHDADGMFICDEPVDPQQCFQEIQQIAQDALDTP